MDIALISTFLFLLGLGLGFLIRGRQGSDQAVALATARAELRAAGEISEGLRDQLETLRADREQLVAQFKAVSGDVLKETSKDLSRQATEAREAQDRQAKRELDQRTETIKGLVKPLTENLDKFDRKIERIDGERLKAAGALGEQLAALQSGVGALGKNADSLVTALRRPDVRGAWGELQLLTAFEHAGLVEGVNFDLQHTLYGDTDGRLRPDAIVFLPGDKSIAVDSKVPFSAYQQAGEATDPAVAEERLQAHAKQVRTHIRALATKDYRTALVAADHATPDFVVMFIPSEAMYFAALKADPSLLEEAIKNKVLLAAPMSLIAILHAVHVGWQQERISEDAREIATIATELHKRFATFFGLFQDIGSSLGKAVERYDNAVGSYERGLVPQFRRLEDHQIKSAKQLPAPRYIDARPRVVTRGMTVDQDAVSVDALPMAKSATADS